MKRAAVLGASGYTGADVIRLLLDHPFVEISLLGAARKAGLPVDAVFPHFAPYDLPDFVSVGDIDWGSADFDVVFCCLPHATTQEVIKDIRDVSDVLIIDLSADFRLRDPDVYAEWYGGPHKAASLQASAVYGLTEIYRKEIAEARLVACPGCYPTAALLALLPLVQAGLIDPARITIDAKSGVSGTGRSLKENLLFTEVAEAMHPYALGAHRHMPEIEQELSVAAGGLDLKISFTPHLIPINRGELLTIYVEHMGDITTEDITACWQKAYNKEAFVHPLAGATVPATRMVRGSNHVVMNAFSDRIDGRSILSVALDNLVKGSSGQAVQNMNLALGFAESTGLTQAPLFP